MIKDLSTPHIDKARAQMEQYLFDNDARFAATRWYHWAYWRSVYWCWRMGL